MSLCFLFLMTARAEMFKSDGKVMRSITARLNNVNSTLTVGPSTLVLTLLSSSGSGSWGSSTLFGDTGSGVFASFSCDGGIDISSSSFQKGQVTSQYKYPASSVDFTHFTWTPAKMPSCKRCAATGTRGRVLANTNGDGDGDDGVSDGDGEERTIEIYVFLESDPSEPEVQTFCLVEVCRI